MSLAILIGDWIEQLKSLPDQSVHCCVTSPPYWGLRNYGVAGQLGLEESYKDYVAKLVEGFGEVRRVLRKDGTLWLNLGDSYARNGGTQGGGNRELLHMDGVQTRMCIIPKGSGLKPKDLVGIPWRVAFALQDAGWYLRQWMPWVKRNSMPESIKDRPVVACETFFLLTKSQHYYYDFEAVKLPGSMALVEQVRDGYNGKATKDFAGGGAQDASAVKRRIISNKQRGHSRRHDGFNARWDLMEKKEQCGEWRSTRNSDWFFESIGGMLLDDEGDPLAMVVNPCGFPGAHFATFPPALVQPCILAGCPVGGTVLDPFLGSGTTAKVALELGRGCIGIEINSEYAAMANERCNITTGLGLL